MSVNWLVPLITRRLETTQPPPASAWQTLQRLPVVVAAFGYSPRTTGDDGLPWRGAQAAWCVEVKASRRATPRNEWSRSHARLHRPWARRTFWVPGRTCCMWGFCCVEAPAVPAEAVGAGGTTGLGGTVAAPGGGFVAVVAVAGGGVGVGGTTGVEATVCVFMNLSAGFSA